MKCPKCGGIITIIADYDPGIYLDCKEKLLTQKCNWGGKWIDDALLEKIEKALSEVPQELIESIEE